MEEMTFRRREIERGGEKGEHKESKKTNNRVRASRKESGGVLHSQGPLLVSHCELQAVAAEALDEGRLRKGSAGCEHSTPSNSNHVIHTANDGKQYTGILSHTHTHTNIHTHTHR